LIEKCHEWLVTKRYLSRESLAARYTSERCALADAGQPDSKGALADVGKKGGRSRSPDRRPRSTRQVEHLDSPT